jgi:predicted TIM-barrel fold metal-dependent hydrolase
MLIDAHNHPDWHKHNLRRFLENMDRFGIDKTWLLTWECPPDEYAPSFHQVALTDDHGPIPFAHCLRYAEQFPERFVLGYAPDPRRADAIDSLQAAIDVYGVRLYGELKLRMCYDPDALRMFHFCGERGLPVTVHIDYEFDTGHVYPRPNYWYGGGIGAFERAVRACPETTFIGHAPGFWAHISGDDQYDKVPYPQGKVLPGGKVVDMLRQYPNLYADLSAGSAHGALHRDLDFARRFCIEFQDRLLFARDYFDHRLQRLLDALELDEEARNKIYCGNALRLLGE